MRVSFRSIGIAAAATMLCMALTGLGHAEPALIGAVKRGDAVDVTRRLRAGAAVDAVDAARNTALIYAARDGHGEIASALIAAGATVDWIDAEGVTPLILATYKGHVEIVRLLLAHGADPSIRDGWKRTAHDYAARRGAGDEIARLLRQSARSR